MQNSVANAAKNGIFVGAAVAVVPLAATGLIACSKIILINLIANVILRVLTGGQRRIHMYGIQIVKVPMLWQISWVSAKVDGAIFVGSLATFLAANVYKHLQTSKASC